MNLIIVIEKEKKSYLNIVSQVNQLIKLFLINNYSSTNSHKAFCFYFSLMWKKL